jgi:formylglycine-generating enzyme required for sulfatase activity
MKKLLIAALAAGLFVPAAGPKPGAVWKEASTGMEFVWIPAGNFRLGSSEGEADEQPVRQVHIRGFWMGRTEVTQAQWTAVMGGNPSAFKKGGDYPVESVSWDEATAFSQKLGVRGGPRFRLPTEAEWEYACKAGTDGQRYGELDQIAWYKDNSNQAVHPVGQKKANAWGLHDMLGNVWEWCRDWYGEKAYAAGPAADPHGPASGTHRVGRGGSWYVTAARVRASFRLGLEPGSRGMNLGFRLVRE